MIPRQIIGLTIVEVSGKGVRGGGTSPEPMTTVRRAAGVEISIKVRLKGRKALRKRWAKAAQKEIS